jgi:type IV pilus biogenesis protein CpaD/CtpE
MKKKNLAMLVVLLLAGCASRFDPDTVAKRDSGTAANPVVQEGSVPEMDPKRKVSEQDCGKPVDTGAGNLMCRK